jgi:hypothetical protein
MSGRNPPYYCPFCGEENLFPNMATRGELPSPQIPQATRHVRPHNDNHGEWECRACRRVFAVKFIGLLGSDRDNAHG